MKVKEIIQKAPQEEFIEIYDSSNTNIFSGMRKFINKDSNFLEKKVKRIWCEDYCSLCIQYKQIGGGIYEKRIELFATTEKQALIRRMGKRSSTCHKRG